jgi:hypothetical protein
MELLIAITSPIPFEGQPFYLQHPTFAEIEEVIWELQKEDLDLRKLVSIKNDSYESKGKEWLEKEWQKSLLLFEQNFPFLENERDQIIKQMNGILGFLEIPSSGLRIHDPFNMNPVESIKMMNDLRNDQLKNSVIVKNDNEIIAFGRLLEVEGSVEIVSLWTKPKWRKRGIAGRVIQELLIRSTVRPMFSFQIVNLIPFYLKEYSKTFSTSICPFTELPPALQRDLFRMNIFWGPNSIIRIG